MNVAVLTLTRDRLAYTQHCFARLREFAGCDFDHWVLDQGSTDGTAGWLDEEYTYAGYWDLYCARENMGINRGMNHILERLPVEDYDVIVKFDNDCELNQPNTLRDVAQLVIEDGNALLSPRIAGLNNPPRETGTFTIGDEEIADVPQIGGVFLAAPAAMYETYRYPEEGPVWGMDDANVCHWYRSQGGRCGYVTRLTANHYETTSGQHARYPEYFERTLAEGKPWL